MSKLHFSTWENKSSCGIHGIIVTDPSLLKKIADSSPWYLKSIIPNTSNHCLLCWLKGLGQWFSNLLVPDPLMLLKIIGDPKELLFIWL